MSKQPRALAGVHYRKAQDVAARFLGGVSIEALAWWFDLSAPQVEACIRRWTVRR